VPALENGSAASWVKTVGSVSTSRRSTIRFSELMFDYPFRGTGALCPDHPGRGQQEGLARGLIPASESSGGYPYVGPRLLAADTAELREKLAGVSSTTRRLQR